MALTNEQRIAIMEQYDIDKVELLRRVEEGNECLFDISLDKYEKIVKIIEVDPTRPLNMGFSACSFCLGYNINCNVCPLHGEKREGDKDHRVDNCCDKLYNALHCRRTVENAKAIWSFIKARKIEFYRINPGIKVLTGRIARSVIESRGLPNG